MRRRVGRKTPGPRSAALNTRKFKTTIELPDIQTDNAGSYLNTLSASIKSVDNTPGNNYGGIGMQTALRSLYEEYKFDAVKYVFVPNYTAVNAGVGLGSSGTVTYAVNKAPGSPLPSAFVDILRQNDCKLSLATKGFSVTVRKPQWGIVAPLGLTVELGATPTNPGVIRNAVGTSTHQWCSTRDFSLPSSSTVSQPSWYGLDVAIEGAPINAVVYRVYATYYMSFRNQN